MWIQSHKWLYGQTPQFTISSHANEEDERPRPPLPKDFPPSVRTLLPVIMYFLVEDTGDLVPNIPATQARVYLKVRGGAIDTSKISISSDEYSAKAEREKFGQVLKDKNIHDIDDFSTVLKHVELDSLEEVSIISTWLNYIFGKRGRISS